MEIKISKNELNKTSRNFRILSSRVLNSAFEDFDSNLETFITYIKQTEIIFNYINSNIKEKINFEEVFKEIKGSYDRITFKKQTNIEDEISYTYQLLEYIVDNKINYMVYAIHYSHSNKFQDMVNAFSNRVILDFVNDINLYIQEVSGEMGYDDREMKYMVVNNGNGQINISKDNSTINAIQNNSSNMEELNKIISKIKQNIPEDINEEDKELIIDSIDGLQEELQKPELKKGRIKSFIGSIKGVIPKVSGCVQFAAALTEIITFVQPMIS